MSLYRKGGRLVVDDCSPAADLLPKNSGGVAGSHAYLTTGGARNGRRAMASNSGNSRKPSSSLDVMMRADSHHRGLVLDNHHQQQQQPQQGGGGISTLTNIGLAPMPPARKRHQSTHQEAGGTQPSSRQRLQHQQPSLDDADFIQKMHVLRRPTIDELSTNINELNLTHKQQSSEPLWQMVQSTSSNRPKLAHLPYEVLVVCFEFADFTMLCRCSTVCRRWNSIGNSPFLWKNVMKHLKIRPGANVGSPAGGGGGPGIATDAAQQSAKQQVERYVVNFRAHLTENLTQMETHFATVEERLRHRLESAAPFTNALVAEAREEEPRLREVIASVEGRLSKFVDKTDEYERLRSHLLSTVNEGQTQLEQLEHDIHGFLKRATPMHREISSRILFEQFERRVCKVLLSPFQSQLPVVLRRGTVTFAGMEMLCLQLGHGGGSGDQSSQHLGNNVRARWKTFKSFFPLSDEYFMLSKCYTFVEEVEGQEAHQAPKKEENNDNDYQSEQQVLWKTKKNTRSTRGSDGASNDKAMELVKLVRRLVESGSDEELAALVGL